jgi:cation transporter-like permease
LAALLGAFIQLIRYNAPRTTAERFLIVLPVSVYTGWASVATVANTSTALKATGFNNMLFADTTWAVIMLLVAGVIGSFVTYVSKGNAAYALTVVWALLGIVVANVVEVSNIGVAITAGSMAAAVAVVLLAQMRNRTMQPRT